MKHISLKTLGTLTLLTCLSSPAHATLMAVSIGGGTNNAVYDDVLNITWLANANLAVTNQFGLSLSTSVSDDTANTVGSTGRMTWNNANAWITAMNNDGSNGYLGVDTWRQPEVNAVNGSSFNTTFTYDGSTDSGYNISAPVNATSNPFGQSPGSTASELSYHYYNNLGGVAAQHRDAGSNIVTLSSSVYGVDDATNTANLALFSNILNSVYWTDTEVASGSSSAFFFNSNNGLQLTFN